MYMDFDKYPPYSGALSENFETNINACIWCNHGFPYSTNKGNLLTCINKESWEMTKNIFLEATQVKTNALEQQYAKYVHMF